MEELKLIVNCNEKHYSHNAGIKKLYKYIAGKGSNKNKEADIYIGAKGLSRKHDKAALQVINIQNALNKAKGRRIYHIVVSFPKDIKDYDMVREAADSIADFLFDDYQVYYAVHHSTDNLHIHFGVNAVSYLTGRKWHNSKKEFSQFKSSVLDKVNRVMEKNHYSPLKL